MTKKPLFLAFLLLCFWSNSFAQTQSEMNATAYANYKKADAQLNKVYKQLMSILDKKEKPLLIQAEKDWMKFRDSHCKFEASQYEGGSIQPLIYSTCLEELTKKRIAEIKASIKERDR
nr:lysozyme inhibitor LprI family protein [uncultured Flavobacterium sp.]